MTPVDPSDAANAVRAGNSLMDHGEVLMRVGVISLIAGVIGGTVAFIREAQQRRFRSVWGIGAFYLSKIGAAFTAGYLALLVLPIWGMGTTVESEQAVCILAALMGGDFIGLLLRRVFGSPPAGESWNGEERRATAHDGDANP